VQEVSTESYVVGCMDRCEITAVIHPGFGCALTAACISCIISPTETLLVNCVTNLGFVFSFSHLRQRHIWFIVRQST